jgi:hypothetical protein
MPTSPLSPPRALACTLFLLTLASTSTACASKRGVDSATTPAPPDSATATADVNERSRPRTADVITVDEIREFGGSASDAYELIRQRRPTFLRPRGVHSNPDRKIGSTGTALEMNVPRVFLDGTYLGPLEALRNVAIGSVVEIRYYNITAASMRFATNQSASPVIEVKTKK